MGKIAVAVTSLANGYQQPHRGDIMVTKTQAALQGPAGRHFPRCLFWKMSPLTGLGLLASIISTKMSFRWDFNPDKIIE